MRQNDGLQMLPLRGCRFLCGAAEFILTLTALILTALDLTFCLTVTAGRLAIKTAGKLIIVLLMALVFLLAYCIILGIHTTLGSGVNSQIP